MQGSKLTIKEIAKLCGISVSTVSRAINNQRDINQETKKKVQAAIEQYGYVPNNSARNLKINDARNIAVLVKGITNPFFNSMLRIFENECARNNYSLVLQHVDSGQDEAAAAALLEKEKRLNGIVFLGGSPLHFREKLDRLQVPFVLCSGALDESGSADYSCVTIDDRRESAKLVDYLIKTGRRRIAILCAGREDDSIGRLRLEGYLSALADNGIAASEELLIRPEFPENTYTPDNGYWCAEQLVASGVLFDAVYAISDFIAVGALRALQDHGIRIPQDVSLAGFDGLEIGKYLTPSLTTLTQPMDAMAYESIRTLLREIERAEQSRDRNAGTGDGNTADSGPKNHRIFECTLTRRESA